ncbi:MAG: synthase [Clostridiales bacterium]|jgi:NAD+ synthase|nr:synthase [Clostridiales bacterium]
MDLYKVTLNISQWLKDRVEDAGAKGLVVGISGGIDSAVVAALCKKTFPNDSLAVIMPCHSNSEDREDAELLAKHLQIPFKTVVLDEVFEVLLKSIGCKEKEEDLAVANIKPRLRMTTLYYFAQKYNYLVAGTGNKSELLTGYFTKYGDGGVDIEPIGHLFKTQVYELAEHLGIPKGIIERTPTAGLWKEQSDEEEMGVTYKELDRYLSSGEAEPHVKNLVDILISRSRHKRQMPPVPSL